jgi:hypothetical protein
LKTVVPFLLISLMAGPGWAEWPPSTEEEARVRNEWETVRKKYESALRGHEKRIAEIDAKEGGFGADQEGRAEKITRDRAAATMASRKSGAKGQALPRTASKPTTQAATLSEIYKAQDEYVDRVTREWGEGAERKKLEDAKTVLQKNTKLIELHLAAVTEATEAMAMRVRQSGVREKAAQSEAAAKEAGERLSARWERERAARERERGQREREAGERARGRP